MIIRLTLILLIAITTLTAQTMVSGNVSGTWDSQSSPYQLTANCNIGYADTLIIEPGVQVDLGDLFEFRVQGVLSANSVVFHNGGTVRGDNGLLDLFNCAFIELEGGIKIVNGMARLDQCHVEATEETGISFSNVDSSYIIDSQVINSGDYGIKISQSDDVEVSGNILVGNSSSDFNHPALFIDSCSPQVIERNTIQENHAQGIGVWTLTAIAAPVIRNNIIRRNYTGITLVNAPPLIENNIIVANYQEGNYNSGAGIYAGYASSRGIVMGNYIAGNYYGISNINNASLNMGDLINDYFSDDGLNLFYDNSFNGETWNIWNGTSIELLAQNNYWIDLDIGAVDATLYDNEEGGGEILFEPIYAPPLPIPPDVNADTSLNILDVVVLIDNLMGSEFPDPITFYLSDINRDYYINVEDVVALIELITEG